MQSSIKLSFTALGHSYIWRIQLRVSSLDSELWLQPRTDIVFVLYSCSGKLAEHCSKTEIAYSCDLWLTNCLSKKCPIHTSIRLNPLQ